MIKNKTPMYERNDAFSMFVPPAPVQNGVYGNTSLPPQSGNGLTIETMRENAEIFDNSCSGLDKAAVMMQAQRDNADNVKRAAQNMKKLKSDIERGKIYK